ncbi:MAG: MFS transporter [Bacteroidetes bacterium]|nr:MFS transporter [Bacteroidota bacterium]
MTGLKRDKKSFILLFSVELWERWAFYGLQALLILFFVQHLGFSDKKAYEVFGVFSALLYLFPSYGGFVCDKILGAKRTLLIGAILLCVGYFMLSTKALSSHIYIALALIAVGGGTFKPNPSRLVAKIYEHEADRTSSAFAWFYMSINIGSLLSMAITPFVAKYYSFNAAFAVSFIGMFIAISNYLVKRKQLMHLTLKKGKEPITFVNAYIVSSSLLGLISLSYYLLQHTILATVVVIITSVIFLAYLFKESTDCTQIERKKLLVGFILTMQAIIFFVFYNQMATTMTLFALRNSSRTLLGMHVPAAMYQLLNPFWIIVFTPILSWFYLRVGKHTKNNNIPKKYALGVLCAGFGLVLIPLICYFAKNDVINGNWFILIYFLESLAEMLVSALGLAMISLYMPKKMQGMTYGAFFLCQSLASIVSAHLASFADVQKGASIHDSMLIYANYFSIVGLIVLAIGACFYTVLPLIKKLES